MKYIEADKITAEIDKIIDGLKRNFNPDPMGTTEECLADAEIEALGLVKDIIGKMKQEEPTLRASKRKVRGKAGSTTD